MASDTNSAPGCIVTLLVKSGLLSTRIDIGIVFEHEGWATGDDVGTGGLIILPELEDDFVRWTTGVAGLGV